MIDVDFKSSNKSYVFNHLWPKNSKAMVTSKTKGLFRWRWGTPCKQVLRPVRRCFLLTFTSITCRSFIIVNFIYAGKVNQIQVHKLYVKFKRQWKFSFISIFSTRNSEICSIKSFEISFYWKKKNLNVFLRPFYSVLLFFFLRTKNLYGINNKSMA